MLGRALLTEATGDEPAAAAALIATGHFFEDLGLPHMAAGSGPDAVRLALKHGDRKEAEHVVLALEAGAATVGLASWHGAALVSRGLLEADPELLLQGVDAYERSPRRLAVAQAREHAGATLCAVGRDEEGRAQLQAAIEVYEETGARRDRARAAAALRAAGGRPSRPRAPMARCGALSAKEQEVAELVGAGLSNQEVADRLFVSRRTVETHLRRIFAKLDLSSRVELALWTAQPARDR
jgi:DNA-binding CsgD family transcriptional regulator